MVLLNNLASRRLVRRDVAVLSLALLLLALPAGVRLAYAALPSNVTVTFNGATYDYGNLTSTFSYEVSVAAGPGAALSHLTLGVCPDVVPNGSGSGPQNQDNSLPGGGTWRVTRHGGANICGGGTINAIVGTDPTTGVRGIKFECAGSGEFQDKGVTATYSYTVPGIWAVDNNVEVGAKAGASHGSAAIGGPDCASIDLAVTTDCADFNSPDPAYASSVTNNNGNKATNVELTVALPKDVAWAGTFASACPSCGTVACTSDAPANPETVVCTLTELAAGATWTIDIPVVDNTSGPALVEHVVSASADETEQYTVNNEDSCSTTTPVTLSFFQAQRTGSSVRFEWATSTETGNVGFHLFVQGTDGGWEPLNAELIPSQHGDSVAPLAYAYTAGDVSGDLFRIEDVDILTRSRAHGPFALGVTYGERPQAEAIDWTAVRLEHAAKADARSQARLQQARADTLAAGRYHATLSTDGLRPASPWSRARPGARMPSGHAGPAYPSVDLLTNGAGIHRVSFAQLQAAGLDLTGVPRIAVAVTHRGRPVPIRIVGHAVSRFDYMEFHAEEHRTLYSETNVYRVVVDPALAARMETVQGAPAWAAPVVPYYLETVQIEKKRQYSFAAPNGDPWFDERLLAHTSPRTWSFDIDAEGYLPGMAPAWLSVGMVGVTNWPGTSPDHHVVVSLNDMPIADERFDGLTDHPVHAPLMEGVLVPHGNRLDITLPGDTGFAFDLVHLYNYAITYPRGFFARADALTFTATGAQFEVTGFSSPDILVHRVVGGVASLLVNTRVAGAPGAYSVRFAGSERPATYYVSVAGALPPVEVRPTPPAADITSRHAQFLILSHPDFLADLGRLVAARTEQGLAVEVVDTEQVYAQFGHGLFDPAAIKAYIAYAARHKGTEAVLLVGGDTYDYLDHLGQGAVGFVPSLYAATDDLIDFAPVDPLYVDVDGDLVPDLPIGRFPVRTSTELSTVIDKTLAYDQKSYGRSGVFAADAYDGSVSYAAHSERFIEELPPDWSAERAYIDDLGTGGARARLVDAINAGVALTSFTGHSSPVAWTYKGLLSSNDVANLANQGKPTVVAQWGCWNTYYVSPSYNTMGHRFMVAGDRGAAAVLGAATLTSSTSERRLGSLVVPRLTQPGVTVGEAVQSAKAELAASSDDLRDVLLGWTLLGDPYLVVQP